MKSCEAYLFGPICRIMRIPSGDFGAYLLDSWSEHCSSLGTQTFEDLFAKVQQQGFHIYQCKWTFTGLPRKGKGDVHPPIVSFHDWREGNCLEGCSSALTSICLSALEKKNIYIYISSSDRFPLKSTGEKEQIFITTWKLPFRSLAPLD